MNSGNNNIGLLEFLAQNNILKLTFAGLISVGLYEFFKTIIDCIVLPILNFGKHIMKADEVNVDGIESHVYKIFNVHFKAGRVVVALVKLALFIAMIYGLMKLYIYLDRTYESIK
ncbi:MAG: hypothetical protein Faunusvirus3_4 [Faunusvirus sp.]|jgi:hypothetical protein|uniref:Uncharacterized protein n=1 Tax=Faunusvirus sp. TaxID=2487766 RepID=A0A3G4ZXQ3_9VIRU|nr:MAG: hypothetical protein Faunusvirus3_4 [Faunusvirus sp.]